MQKGIFTIVVNGIRVHHENIEKYMPCLSQTSFDDKKVLLLIYDSFIGMSLNFNAYLNRYKYILFVKNGFKLQINHPKNIKCV